MGRENVFYGLDGAGHLVVVWRDPEQPKHHRLAPTRVTLETPHEVFVEAVRAAEQLLLGVSLEYIDRR